MDVLVSQLKISLGITEAGFTSGDCHDPTSNRLNLTNTIELQEQLMQGKLYYAITKKRVVKPTILPMQKFGKHLRTTRWSDKEVQIRKNQEYLDKDLLSTLYQ